MSLIKLDFISFYFITFGSAIFFFWPFWLLIPLALMGFASPSEVSCFIKPFQLMLSNYGIGETFQTMLTIRNFIVRIDEVMDAR